MDPDLLGAILLVPYSFIPEDYEECSGKALNRDRHDRLFDLIGTQFGGDGTPEFNLPDLSAPENFTYIITTNGVPPA